MPNRLTLAVLVLFAGELGWRTAGAQDRPVTATKVELRRSMMGEKLVFASKDPTFLFPAIGGADDPTAGGATIEVFSQSEGTSVLSVPAGAPWQARDATTDAYRYLNKAAPGGPSPARMIALRQGKTIRLLARSVGLPLAAPQGVVGIRITTGGVRNCARFDAGLARRNEPGRFLVNGVVAPAPADCSDLTLGGFTCGQSPWPDCNGSCPAGSGCSTNQTLDGCTCISSAQPCGNTSPVCNGECPAGEECMATGGFPLTACNCLPAGSVPCGGGNFACGGACPSGSECNFVDTPFPGSAHCECGPPGPCGSGGDDCPVAGTHCALLPGVPPTATCVPNFCGGSPTFPVCGGGTCGAGQGCLPLATTEVGLEFCVCADPGPPCDAACGGLACPAGQVCTADLGTQSCSCQVP